MSTIIAIGTIVLAGIAAYITIDWLIQAWKILND